MLFLTFPYSEIIQASNPAYPLLLTAKNVLPPALGECLNHETLQYKCFSSIF